MNKYKMAVSCGKGLGIVKTIEKTWFKVVQEYPATILRAG